MDADRARHLRQAADRFFDFVAGDHHQVGELVDHHHDEGEWPIRLALFDRFAGFEHLAHVAIELLDIPDAKRGKRLVALFHFAHGPAQRVGRLLRLYDDRRHEMRNVFIHSEFEALRVHHDHADVIGRRSIQNAGQHRVEADGLTGTGRAGDQQVRHRRQVGDVRLAVYRLAECHGQFRAVTGIGIRLEQLAQRDRFSVGIRDLDADGGLAGDAIDQHRFGLHGEAQVVGEPGHLRVLHARIRLELEGGDDGTRMDLDDRAFHRELPALFLEQPRGVHELAFVDLGFRARCIEQGHRR